MAGPLVAGRRGTGEPDHPWGGGDAGREDRGWDLRGATSDLAWDNSAGQRIIGEIVGCGRQ